jgi:hypothetical protein
MAFQTLLFLCKHSVTSGCNHNHLQVIEHAPHKRPQYLLQKQGFLQDPVFQGTSKAGRSRNDMIQPKKMFTRSKKMLTASNASERRRQITYPLCKLNPHSKPTEHNTMKQVLGFNCLFLIDKVHECIVSGRINCNIVDFTKL